jgi:protein SCO1/2
MSVDSEVTPTPAGTESPPPSPPPAPADADLVLDGGPTWLRLAVPVLALVATLAALAAYGAWRLLTPATAEPQPGMLVLGDPDATPSPLKGFALVPERPAPELALDDPSGQPWRLADHRDEVVALFFGYTHCPDVCPQTMQRLAEAARLLGPADPKLTVALVTVDPERDTPAVLGEYARGFHPDFVGLTGAPEAIRAAAEAYGVRYMKELPPDLATQAAAIAGHDEVAAGASSEAHEDEHGDEPAGEHGGEHADAPAGTGSGHGSVPSVMTPGTDAYTVAHSGVIFIVDGEGQLRSSFLGPFDPADVVHDVRYLAGTPQPASR